MSEGEAVGLPTGRINRAASIARAGARIGGNYVKYYGRKALQGVDDRESLHRANAEDSFTVLAKLRGGPLKVAQMLSIDRNLLPQAYSESFARAHHGAPPLAYPLVERVFRREMGCPPEGLFDRFEREAVRAASIGQVHRAWKDGHAYAVKIQYPGVATSLRSDLRMLRPLAARLFDLNNADLDVYFGEVEARLLEETDYALELKRAVDLADHCRDLAQVNFPAYHPELSCGKILTMDWVEGQTFDHFLASAPDATQRNHIGQALWDFYHRQIHELQTFHADPHPGNFLIKDDQLWVLDFGCVKVLPSGFHADYFHLLDPACHNDPDRLEKHLETIALILPQDSPADRARLVNLYEESIRLLARPFLGETFDFGDTAYSAEIYAFGERTRQDPEIKKLNNARGSPHALYLNRTFFGLYSLLRALAATVSVHPVSLAGVGHT
jgi:predicted unusual protein kinase regulating ubiquinone biosynthesis (AarF/ABC1/UbiB family)